MDYAPSCELTVPGRLPRHGEGWYLLAADQRVEAGPFPDERTAWEAAQWLDDHGRGVNPAPWVPLFSRLGLLVGARWRPARKARAAARVDSLVG